MISIGNVAINMSDLERSDRFYVEGLGLQVLSRIDTPEVREVIVGTPGKGSQLMLAKHTSACNSPSLRAFGRSFSSPTMLPPSLHERSLPAPKPSNHPSSSSSSASRRLRKDPDGYLLELGANSAHALAPRPHHVFWHGHEFDILEGRRLDRVEHNVLLLTRYPSPVRTSVQCTKPLESVLGSNR